MFNIFYYKHPRYTVGKVIIKTVESEEKAHRECNIFNQDGGYEDENGKKYLVDYEYA